MATIKAQRLGGIANGGRLRSIAIAKYYLNPGKCKLCCKVIEVLGEQKIFEVKRKRFCSVSCATKFNNALRPPNPPKIKIPKIRKPALLPTLTKRELIDKRSHWISWRAAISRHAREIFAKSGNEKKCVVYELL